MNWEILFSFLGSAVGCIAGILAAQRLTNFRLQQLETKVSQHNHLVERMTVSELRLDRLEQIEKERKEGRG